MNYIYTNRANGRKYFLIPEINMGDKVCIRDMANNKDKFVKPATLKKNYFKDVTEDIIVEVRAFTGMFIGLYRASIEEGKPILVWGKSKWMQFDDSGIQMGLKNPKFASKICYQYTNSKHCLDWALS